MKATITWLREPDSTRPTNEWAGYVFEAGKPLEVTNRHVIEKAKANRHFKVENIVEDDAPNQPRPSLGGPSVTQNTDPTGRQKMSPPPPSQTGAAAQGPVVKHGEPVSQAATGNTRPT